MCVPKISNFLSPIPVSYSIYFPTPDQRACAEAQITLRFYGHFYTHMHIGIYNISSIKQ